jgi:phospholipid transport system transporter-binding protein
MMLQREGEMLRLDGPVTFDTVPGLVSAAEDHFRQGARVVDFAGVTEVDSSAVALALEWVRQAERASIALRLVNVPASIHNLAKLYGVSDLLQQPSA